MVSRLGVIYTPPLPAPPPLAPPLAAPLAAAPRRPYKAEHDAVSLAFFRRFYDALVKPRDDAAEAEAAETPGTKPRLTTTDEVAKELIMAACWDAETGRALRFAETMAKADCWGGPESQREAFFVSHGAQPQSATVSHSQPQSATVSHSQAFFVSHGTQPYLPTKRPAAHALTPRWR